MEKITIHRDFVLNTEPLDFFYYTYAKNSVSITLAPNDKDG